jgi:protoheme IX farnesyltransferase
MTGPSPDVDGSTGAPRAGTDEPADADAPRADADRRLTDLLVATTLGVYLLVVVGAATALLDGAAACSTWPTCGGNLVPTRADPALLAAWGHRAATLVVGALVALTAWRAWRRGAPLRVRAATLAVAALYPGQTWLGALVATGGAPVDLASLHLVVGVAIFAVGTLALLWQLEAETGVADGTAAPDSADDLGAQREAAAGTQREAAASDPPSPDDGREDPDGPLSRAGAYVRLTKPRLWWLLCLVAVAAMGLAAGPSLSLSTVVPTLVGGVLAIGASGTFNNVLERDVDRKMARTEDRPLVEGRIPLWRAVAFGVALAVASVAVFLAFVNALAAALGVLAVLYYSVGYTLLLKPNTDQNIVLGGAVGAFPALIGWAAAADAVGLPALVLGAVVFLWTPAHFYNLALVYRDDYERAGFPMLPVVRGAATTRRHVLLYFGATMAAAVALGGAERLGWLYAGAVMAVAAVFLRELVGQYRSPSDRTALRTFHASNAYLGVVLAVVAVDAMVV